MKSILLTLIRNRLLMPLCVIGISGAVYLLACNQSAPKAKVANLASTSAPQSCICNPSDQFSVSFGSNVPGDNVLISNQMDANCFAWQEFVALNWPTDGSMFGAPLNYNPVQWETYMSTDELFLPGGATPPAWGSGNALLSQKKFTGATKVLTQITKVGAGNFINGIGQAAPSGKPNWLGAQNGTNLWYEVMVNYDEYAYIVDSSHQFYNADKQQAWVAANKPIVFPSGNSNTTGALELKAAWMEVTDPGNSKWQRYKCSKAVLLDPQTGQHRQATVALVGLHILHKMASQPTWFWATFEHVDNLPGATRAQAPYNFYNPECQAKQVAVSPACAADSTSTMVSVDCTPNISPPYYLCPGGPAPVPIQVSRVTPLDAVNTIPVNDTMQNAIARLFPNSVWQNYQLINALWSTSPYPDPLVPVQVPAKLKSMTPSTPVANSTLETYVQTTTCTGCHQFATIAPTAGNPNPTISSNFSFVLGLAQYPGAKLDDKKFKRK